MMLLISSLNSSNKYDLSIVTYVDRNKLRLFVCFCSYKQLRSHNGCLTSKRCHTMAASRANAVIHQKLMIARWAAADTCASNLFKHFTLTSCWEINDKDMRYSHGKLKYFPLQWNVFPKQSCENKFRLLCFEWG